MNSINNYAPSFCANTQKFVFNSKKGLISAMKQLNAPESESLFANARINSLRSLKPFPEADFSKARCNDVRKLQTIG